MKNNEIESLAKKAINASVHDSVETFIPLATFVENELKNINNPIGKIIRKIKYEKDSATTFLEVEYLGKFALYLLD